MNAGPGTVNNPGGTSLQGNWHTYGVRWTPSAYYFYIDGTQVGTSTTGISMRTQWIYLSTFVNGASWAGAIPAGGYGTLASTTTKMDVDYVRFYQRAETVVNGDFEGRMAPWFSVNQASWSPGLGHNTSNGVRVNPNSTAGSSADQYIYGLLPNTNYVLTGWANAAATTWTSMRIGARDYGGPFVYSSVNSNGFTQGNVTFTTGLTNTSGRIYAWVPTQYGDIYADDVLLRRTATVNNGSLEAGELGAWTYYGGTSVVNDGNTYGGGFALKYTSGTTASGAEQEIVGLTPGTAYRLSGWTTNGGQGLRMGVKNYGGADTSTNVPANTWTRGTVDFTTGAGSTAATVYAWRASSTATSYADSFFLYQPFVSPWASQDVQATGLAGAAGTLGNRFVIQAAGADIWDVSDKFHFVNRSMTGDGQITARILGLDNTNISAKTGVMMRESASSFARSVMVDWTPGQTVEFARRTVTSGTCTADTVTGIANAPWVRLARRGNLFTAYYSADGTTWVRLGSPLTIAMGATILVGLPACSHDTTLLTEAVLDNVSLATPPPEVAISTLNGVTMPGIGSSLRITATLTDSGAQGVPVIAWTKISGPGVVTFAHPALADTSAAFSATGTYVLQCAATTSAGTGTAQFTANVIASPDPTLALWLKLNETTGTTAADSSGNGRNATLLNTPTWVAGTLNNALSLNGTSQYATMPPGSVSGLVNFTASAWVNPTTVSAWARIFDFGTGTTNYMFLTPMGGPGGPVRFAIKTGSGEQQINGTTALISGVWTHVAVTISGATGILYVNGVEVGRNSSMTLKPSSLGNTTFNYLGKS